MSTKREESSPPEPQTPSSPLRGIVQPFIDLARAPRALWGVALSHIFFGLAYFGMVGYLSKYFHEHVALDDVYSSWMVMVLTAGITLSTFLFGELADRWGVRRTLLSGMASMAAGLAVLALAPSTGLSADGLGSGVHLVALGGILLLIVGYGMYMPAAYAAVRQITTEKTAAMGFAMLYALMNLGGWLPTFFPPVRRALGIAGTYWVFAGIMALGVIAASFLLTRRATERAIALARAEREKGGMPDQGGARVSPSPPPQARGSFRQWLKNHPLADLRFTFFIFALIPVQTLLAHTWLTLPQYTSRAYEGTWIGENFEAAYAFNSLLIFLLVPVITALTRKVRVYRMLVLGTLVMAAPTFLLALGPNFVPFLLYLILMTVGEAMWQPRFLQFAAEIAPEGRTGAYMGVSQLPWFLTKVLTGLYAGWFLQEYCPEQGERNTEFMWFVHGCIAISSTVLLLLARRWLASGLKERADPGR